MLYSKPSNREISLEVICKEEWFVGSYETVDEALSVNDKMDEAGLGNGLFEGLEQALRVAADGMVDEMPEVYCPVGTIDSLAANLFKLSARDSIQEIKGYFKKYSPTSVDIGNKLIANLSIPGEIAIILEFHDEKLTKITLSEGLRNVIRRKLGKGGAAVEGCVMKWLR